MGVLVNNEAASHNTTELSFIQVEVTLARRPTFIVVNIILPIAIMGFLNICVFVLPADSGERMSYAVTILLSMAVYLTIVSDNIPKTSRPVPLLCYFLGAHVLLSSTICFATILNCRLFYKDENISLPSWIKMIVRKRQSEDSYSPSLSNTLSESTKSSLDRTRKAKSNTENASCILLTQKCN